MKCLYLIGCIYSMIAFNVHWQPDHNDTPFGPQFSSMEASNLFEMFSSESKCDIPGAAQHYLAFTLSVDQFIVIEDGTEKIIESKRMDERLFDFKCQNPSNTYIRLENDACDNPPSLLLCRQADGKSTERIYIESGETISVDSCFTKYPDKTCLADNAIERLSCIFQKVRTSRMACGPTPTLKGGEGLGENEASLVFEEADYSYYLDWDDFSVRFNAFEANPVKGIYMISHSGELIFCAGDTRLVEKAFDLSDAKIPPLDIVVNARFIKEKKLLRYELNTTAIRSNLFGEIKKEEWYELGIHVEDDLLDYVFNFQFITNEEKLFFETFISND